MQLIFNNVCFHEIAVVLHTLVRHHFRYTYRSAKIVAVRRLAIANRSRVVVDPAKIFLTSSLVVVLLCARA